MPEPKKEPRDLWREEACGYQVYVRRYPRGALFYDSKKPFSAWIGGGGIGHDKTLKESIQTAHAYLVFRIRQKRAKAINDVIEADKFLAQCGEL